MSEHIFLLAALVAGAVGALLIVRVVRKPDADGLSSLLAILGGIFLFFAVGLLFKGLGIASPLDNILVPPPLPQ